MPDLSELQGAARRARRRVPSRALSRTVLATAMITALVAGCSGGAPAPGPSATYTAPVPVIQPGKPGEPATSLAPGETAARPPDAGWNSADLYFVSMMVLHHTQALRVARLVPGRSSNPQVQAVAERISAAQAPEILTLKAWLAARKQKIPNSEDGGHGHGGMAGALTPAQLEALARASGGEFDRAFLQLMVAHHAGAVQMAGTVTTAGTDLAVQEIAAETAVGQNAEIRRMESIRARL